VTVALVIFGLLLVVVALHDIFRTLFHPAAHGAMSDWIARLVWNVSAGISDRTKFVSITMAGPLAILAIIATWTGLIVFGCSLIYFADIQHGFAVAAGLNPAQHRNYLDAFNISLGALITLGGDFNAHSSWVRLLMGLEALFGFGVLTASVSWLLSIYPVLETRRSLAENLFSLREAEIKTGIPVTALPAPEAEEILAALASQLTTLRNEMSQFPITYYFNTGESVTALSAVMPYLRALAERAAASDRPEGVRLSGAMLRIVAHNYLTFIARNFLHIDSTDDEFIIRRYAADQRRELVDIVEPRARRIA
jgi:hypothetical protein